MNMDASQDRATSDRVVSLPSSRYLNVTVDRPRTQQPYRHVSSLCLDSLRRLGLARPQSGPSSTSIWTSRIKLMSGLTLTCPHCHLRFASVVGDLYTDYMLVRGGLHKGL